MFPAIGTLVTVWEVNVTLLRRLHLHLLFARSAQSKIDTEMIDVPGYEFNFTNSFS